MAVNLLRHNCDGWKKMKKKMCKRQSSKSPEWTNKAEVVKPIKQNIWFDFYIAKARGNQNEIIFKTTLTRVSGEPLCSEIE